jgi:outer membrane protein OmpU
MKKHLLGTTALVAAGMFAMVDTAAAQTKVQPIQVSVGGYWAEYVSYTNQDDRGTVVGGSSGELIQFDQWSDKEIHFNGRTTLDNGLTIGFRAEMEANTEADQIDESFMFVEGRFGRMELGAINNVQYRMAYKAPEAQTRPWSNEGNIFNVMANPTGTATFDTMLGTTVSRFHDNDSEKINYYTPRFEGFQLGLSYIPDSSQDRNGSPPTASVAYSRGWAVAANFVRTFGAFDVAAYAGYMQWQGPELAVGSAPDPDQWNVGLQLGFAGFKVGGSYGQISDGRTGAAGTAGVASAAGTGAGLIDGRAFDLGVMYTFGPAAISLNYFDGENDEGTCVGGTCTGSGEDTFQMISLGGKYTLGPGVSLEANIFHAELEGAAAGSADDNEATGAIVGVVLVF